MSQRDEIGLHRSVRPLAGGGEMGALMRSIDWSKTAVGPVEGWPQSLRTALSILLETGFPMAIAWGNDFTLFYNDGCRPILGSTKHPAAMGSSTCEAFAEIWNTIGPMFDNAMRGTPTTLVDFLLPLDRHGFIEECYFILACSPIREESGDVGGVLITVTETTERVLGARRFVALPALSERTQSAPSAAEACRLASEVLCEHGADVPFTLLYLLESDGKTATLLGASGLEPGIAAAPRSIDLADREAAWPIAHVVSSMQPVEVDHLVVPMTSIGKGIAPAAPTRACCLPLAKPGDPRATGVLVAGLSPHLCFDANYRSFLGLVAGQVAMSIASARALAEAQARVEALAQLDRAKTAFFSNVSHEFRTPLTLLLGPTKDALSSPARCLAGEGLEAVHRNALRLQKLVNTLLDFSRIEAGRVQASYELTDLGVLTCELASVFRSAIECTGLGFTVEVGIVGDVYVDREMWEKIVLNLLSNALKFTFEGQIAVRLEQRDGHAVLTVSDSGIGVPPGDLPFLFDRFHRVYAARARTHEGTGIGLALVQELVRLHGGTIEVTSTVGEGTTFTIALPLGRAHLPEDRIAMTRTVDTTAFWSAGFVAEALHWSTPPLVTSGEVPRSPPDRPAGVAPLAAGTTATAPAQQPGMRTLMEQSRWRSLAEQERGRLYHHVMQAPVPVSIVVGPDFVYDLANPQHERMVGRAGLAGMPVRRILPEGSGDEPLIAMLERVYRTGEPFEAAELPLAFDRRADDVAEQAYFKVTCQPIIDGDVMSIMTVAVDVTEQVRARRKVEHARALLETVVQQMPAGVILAEAVSGRVLLTSERVREILGHVALPTQPGDGLIARALRGEMVRDEEIEIVRGDGSRITLLTSAAPVHDHQGKIVAAIKTFSDITKRKVLEQHHHQLFLREREARDTAELASRSKDEFLAMLGHELRNPLAPILTALQLIRLRGDGALRREQTVIERQVNHLVRLVDDLLDITRITRGKIDLKREPVELRDVLAKAIEMTGPLFAARQHHLDLDVPGTSMVIDGDPVRLAQVFSNLLTNAAKYTEPHGQIVVRVRREGDALVITVRDSGIGLSAELLPRVFDLFAQERQAIAHSQGGLGLGLAIVRSLVELHGGSVEARSNGTGLGAEFTVRLPAREACEATAHAGAGGRGVAAMVPFTDLLRVLIVDDNEDAAELLAESLRTMGYAAQHAHDAPAALDLASQFRPDIAVLDIDLPLIDGYKLARLLHTQPATSHTRLIALSGYSQEPDQRRSKEAGFVEYIVKPTRLNVVVKAIERYR